MRLVLGLYAKAKYLGRERLILLFPYTVYRPAYFHDGKLDVSD
ncbi:hypothetical protein [Paenibacillus sacheonensis]|nr:hypothetical protein [Paenibacillus sacheonensis]